MTKKFTGKWYATFKNLKENGLSAKGAYNLWRNLDYSHAFRYEWISDSVYECVKELFGKEV